MLKTVESVSAKLSFYCLLLCIIASVGAFIPLLNIPVYFPVIIFLVGIFFILLSFQSFRLQIQSWYKGDKLIWYLLLLPLILYIPANIILLRIGLVDLKFNDFGAYYNAAERVLNGAPLYQTTNEVPDLQAEMSSDMPYIYPPIFVLLFIPLTIFSTFVAGIVWDIIVLIFLVWSVSVLVSTFEISISRKNRFLIYLCVISFGPTLTWIKLGQVSGLLAGFLCLSAATLRMEEDELSGVFTTLGSAVKPFYATSGAHLLRSRSRLLSALLSGSGILMLGVLIFGTDANLEYLNVLRQGKGWETAIPPENWHATHFNPFIIFGQLKFLLRIIFVLGTIAVSLYSRKLNTPVEYVFALGVAIVPLAGPTTNTLALNAVIPAIIVVGFYELEQTGEFPKILLFSTFLVHIHPYTIEFLSKLGPQIYPPLEVVTPVVPLLQPALYGTTLLVVYIFYRILYNPFK